MPFHWQSNLNAHQNIGVQDMVLLRQLSDEAIVDNLRTRLGAMAMFTYIGDVLVSVNPFKQLSYFTEKEIEMYQCAARYENPPHIFAIADSMYRNILMDDEGQCVIISGESGAGKTVSAKLIMSYITKITSEGSRRVQKIKEVVLKSNPLLEAFGNASTIRNWNSSRFGKYTEIMFDKTGKPVGGRISNFLLEKSRVVSLGAKERSFHIFYQMIAGLDAHTKRSFGLTSPDAHNYLGQSGCFFAEGTDDRHEFTETLSAMKVMGFSDELQLQIFRVVAAILHIGNISFGAHNNYSAIADDDNLRFPSYLLGISSQSIKEKLTTRRLNSKWGAVNEEIDVLLNIEQAAYTRDAWSKAIYARLFDFLISAVNNAMRAETNDANLLSIGILDIYGFEIFEQNGFEQFCINFVNEKIQQIFIELTLKSEQEEYVSEGIEWTPIEFFNNKVVCDLIEAKSPPGIMLLLDDICAQIHGQSDGVDEKFLVKLGQQVSRNEHFKSGPSCFVVTHYAGEVVYQVAGFCDRNRDILYPDLIQLMQSSSSKFIRDLFPENIVGNGTKSKPTSASSKIRSQAKLLVDSLARCTPHYIRCIKPNECKTALNFDSSMVLHQVKYLGLRENVRVRRAGFAYRHQFDKFIKRYGIICEKTWPKKNADKLSSTRACEFICLSARISTDQFQLGRTKIFIKNPESLFLLEETRERRFDWYARVLQKAFRKFTAQKQWIEQKKLTLELLYGKKERRRLSINRNFMGDYVGLANKPALQAIAGKRERIEFAQIVNKYDRKFASKRVDLLLTSKAALLVVREKLVKRADKGKLVDTLSRQIPLECIEKVVLSPYQDDFLLVNVIGSHSTLLETPLKSELLTILNKLYKQKNGLKLPIDFNANFEITLKKTWMDLQGNPGTRHVHFASLPAEQMNGCVVTRKIVGKVLQVSVAPGLPSSTQPSALSYNHLRTITNSKNKSNAQIANGINNTRNGAPTSKPIRKAPAPAPSLKPKAQGHLVKALFPYEAQDTDELTFQKNQVIELLKKDDSGWWQGRIGPNIGLFPSNYVQEM